MATGGPAATAYSQLWMVPWLVEVGFADATSRNSVTSPALSSAHASPTGLIGPSDLLAGGADDAALELTFDEAADDAADEDAADGSAAGDVLDAALAGALDPAPDEAADDWSVGLRADEPSLDGSAEVSDAPEVAAAAEVTAELGLVWPCFLSCWQPASAMLRTTASAAAGRTAVRRREEADTR